MPEGAEREDRKQKGPGLLSGPLQTSPDRTTSNITERITEYCINQRTESQNESRNGLQTSLKSYDSQLSNGAKIFKIRSIFVEI